jgi:polyhydroxyalkanoate synthesis regulator phasin
MSIANWESRIIESAMVDAETILANPQNFRKHPKHQKEALAGVLNEIGWIQDVIVNRTTGHLIDGHLRVELAAKDGGQVPVKYVELTEKEEKIALASIDPISALAEQDQDMLDDLIEQIGTVEDDDLSEFLDSLLSEDEQEPESPEELAEQARETLAERFIVPPFSVLDSKQGYWQERKRAWQSLGIKSELGRKEDMIFSVSSQPPHVYDFKKAVEKDIGQTLSWKEFAERYPEEVSLTGTSIFDPVLTEVLYSWFCPQGGSILDPFAGGSVRGVVAGFMGYHYTGVELREEQVTANKRQGHTILGEHATAEWINADSRNIPDVIDQDEQFDFLFSCPPYADLEVYSDDPNDISTLGYPEFVEAYSDIIKKACDKLKDDSFAVFVVGEVRSKKGNYYGFVQDTIAAFEAAGLSYYNEVILLTSIASNALRASGQFTKSRKLSKVHQNALVFAKGAPVPQAIAGLSNAITDHFNEYRHVFKAYENVMVFCKGDPKQATAKIGDPITLDVDDLITETMNGE